MSQFFAYICTRTTADPYLPQSSPDLRRFTRDVSDAFVAISGGFQRVGAISLFPVQRTVPNNLLCDGQEVAKVSFPELYDYLGDTQGTASDTDYFVLPNYVADFVAATAAEPETVVDGTVTTPTIPDTYERLDSHERADSGGRIPRTLDGSIP